MSDWIEIDGAEFGNDHEEGPVGACITCQHNWSDHACWPTHTRHGNCFRCDCNDFREVDQS